MPKLKIRNKATGEIKEIEASEAQNFGLDPKVALERFKAQSELEKAAGGEDITLSPDEQKKARGRTDAERVVTLLEDRFFSGNQGKSIGYGKGQGISKNLELMTAFGETISPELEDISSYRALRDSARPAFARAMGDVGNLSEPEQRAAIKNIPDIYQTRGQALAYFRDVRQKLGLPERNIEKQQQPVNLTQALLSGGLNIGQNPQQVSQTQAPQQSQNPLMQLLQRGQQGGHTNLEANFLGKLLFPRASDVQSRQNRGEQIGLGERVGVAGETAANILPFAGPGGLAMRLGLSGASRGLTEPGANIGQRITGGLVGGVTGATLGKGGELLGKILRPFKTVGEIRRTAVEKGKELTFSGDDIVQAGKEYIKHDPTAKSVANKILPAIKGKIIPLSDLMRKIDVWNDAYTAAGRVGKSAEAGLNNVLAQAAKSQIAQKAPDISKANKLFSFLYGTQKNIGRYGGSAAIGAGGAGVTYYLLDKLLGRDRGY